MAVQWVNRPCVDFRGYSGTVLSGSLCPGDKIAVAASGSISKVARIATFDGDLDRAVPGDAVTLILADELDIARGDILTNPERPPEISNQFAAHLIWMSKDQLLPGRSYLLKIGAKTVPASITALKHRLDVNTLGKHAAKTLALNEVGFCNLATIKPIAFAPYDDNREMGGFILIDRFTNATAAAGLITFGLRRASNIHHQDLAVDKKTRARLKHQKPAILWFTGLSGAGKSTIANVVEARLCARGVHTLMLDGDNIREGLCKDLGFTEVDRVENIRRVGEVAKLMTEAGLIVLCCFISPFRAERQMVRELVEDGEFIEVFVDTPIHICIERDPKGLYKRARAGEIKNFSGVDQRYEVPQGAELVLHGARERPEVLADRVIDELLRRNLVDSL
jgi:bifunctional enzyme CysN/CysC